MLFHGEPRQEEAVGLDFFPVGNRAARYRFAMPTQQFFQFTAAEPALPCRRFQSPPGSDVLIDDRDPATGFDYSAQFFHCFRDIDRVFERFSRIGAMARA